MLLRDEEEGGYVGWVPALGCYTQGEDIPESLRMAEEAIVSYLDGERELGTFSRPCGSAIHRANHITQLQAAH